MSSQAVQNFINPNKVWISGIIEGNFEFSHAVFDDKFFSTMVKVERSSGNVDYLPIVVPERLIHSFFVNKKYVELKGSLRSVIKLGDDGKYHLDIYIFPFYLVICDKKENLPSGMNINSVYLQGYISKNLMKRVTPLGRTITDFMIRVERSYSNTKTYSIPCIAWGDNANVVSKLSIGDEIKVFGRLQSRRYFKQLGSNPDDGVWKQTYELSVFEIF